MTYILSIETDAGTYTHGYHLGTIESTARAMAEHVFDSYTPRQGTVIRTVALMVNGKMVDCYDGQWFNNSEFAQAFLA
jgi:hypothetical protein